MHPMSHSLAHMVVLAAASGRNARTRPLENPESERSIERNPGEMARTRPRIVRFAPATALKRALALITR